MANQNSFSPANDTVWSCAFHLKKWTLVLAVFLCGAPRAQPQSLLLTGSFSGVDNHTYREIPFEVPPDTVRITIDLTYTGREQHTAIDLGLFDQERFRGWSGGKPGPVSLSETDATPSYLPGSIRPGTWKLLLAVPNIRAEIHSQYSVKIDFQRRGTAATVSTFSGTPIRAGAAWYRGDMHLHTAHSDGSCTNASGKSVPCPVYIPIATAAERHLDFVAMTDHNTTAHYDALRELQPFYDRLLIIPGREVTTFEGHANVFGTTEFIDFRVGSPWVPTMTDMFRQVERLHALISINHPNDPTGEECMGCKWTTSTADLSHVQAVEAVNALNAEGPIAGIPFWEAQLNQGFHLTGIGGSDTHSPDDRSRPNSGVGYPTTVVYANKLSEHAILDGVRASHVFIDTEGTRDRVLELTATSKGKAAAMGDTLLAASGVSIRFSIHSVHVNGAKAEVIEDGRPVTLLKQAIIQGDDSRQAFEVTADGKHHWIRINIRASDNRLLLVGNPIYW